MPFQLLGTAVLLAVCVIMLAVTTDADLFEPRAGRMILRLLA